MVGGNVVVEYGITQLAGYVLRVEPHVQSRRIQWFTGFCVGGSAGGVGPGMKISLILVGIVIGLIQQVLGDRSNGGYNES